MRKYLYFTIFVAGMGSLAIEMAASRLLSNVYGTSNLVWAAIIGLILIYLAAGNYLGGKWVDRSPRTKTFFTILLFAGISTALVPLAAQPILRGAANAFDSLQIGMIIGAFVSVMILMVVPIILLGMVSPFSIRIIADAENIQSDQLGRLSGQIYAISTGGSFLGTFLPGLLLIPTIGTYQTFVLLGGLLTLIAFVGLIISEGMRFSLRYSWAIPLILLLAFFGIQRTIKSNENMIYEDESAYNYIQVLEVGEFRYLRLNDGQGQHSVYSPNADYYGGPWSQVLVAPYFNQPPVVPADIKRIAIVGLAAGTTARQASIAYPDAIVDGWEIDPEIIEVGYEFFDMDLPNLNAYAQDGRWGLEHSPYTYDIISVDAYRPPYIPPHLTTQEFFKIAYNHLNENGVLVINVGRTDTDRRLVNALASTMKVHFPTVHAMDLPLAFNTILFATKQPTTRENFTENLVALWEDPSMDDLLRYAMQNTYANFAEEPQASIIFTDDKAPIEWMTNNLMIAFALGGGVENLEP